MFQILKMKNYEQILLKVSFLQTIMFLAEMLCRIIFSEQVMSGSQEKLKCSTVCIKLKELILQELLVIMKDFGLW